MVQCRYRTLPTPDFWAIGGLSSGAWGAVNVGLHHLDHFSILFSHSGYFIDKSSADNSPLAFIQTLPESQLKKLRIYPDVGTSDETYLMPNVVFHQMLDRFGVSNVLHEFPGSHRWEYWQTHLADSLSYVGEQFHIAQAAYVDRSNRQIYPNQFIKVIQTQIRTRSSFGAAACKYQTEIGHDPRAAPHLQ